MLQLGAACSLQNACLPPSPLPTWPRSSYRPALSLSLSLSLFLRPRRAMDRFEELSVNGITIRGRTDIRSRSLSSQLVQ
ncbi:uncharacterized protein BO95DRAFT_445221 [Aspergillus brunneoviolaceus CBS 621.78]|uniref:Uncharacterized protein n=1 Tax=Aspergillus brunneoviolaceus CBS 621.78 TaxID=1450534 RepID=A0ACD1G2K0_9EURO|nr:hypothetical protein BO95DRAFT_445221 [Aspergillus brunneoviolaceus CBS 621.78]RAH43417.1 hypothetical protein BO95DRAFT_445221 [Aspergillus brunneoviolaceus CBS 621.78]